jgi:putative ATP-binding cassette transporter
LQAKPHETADWGAVKRLILPYWRSEERWTARGLLFAIIALALGMVYLNVLFTEWNLTFYNALQNRNFAEFKHQLWRFSYLAFIFITIAIYRVYLEQALEMRWRRWLTQRFLDDWLSKQAYYRIEQTGTADNPDQRIAEDLMMLTSGTLGLTLGLLSSVVTLVSFVGILWSVSGAVTLAFAGHDWTVNGYMVWFALAYAGGGSLLVWWVGKPLVGQNFKQQKFEANFRFGLVRIRENAEAVALYRGEVQEQEHLKGRFEQIRANWWGIMRTTKRLNVVSNFYAQFANIFPFLVASPRYFSGAIQLGGLMQISSAFGQVQEALSWFINAFSSSGADSLPTWKASVNRLAGFHAAVMSAREQESGISVARNNVGAILLDDLVLCLPDGRQLCAPVTMEIRPGERILVEGPSGCGKSTLFRAIAGIWPYGAGGVELPSASNVLFLPQKAYLPIGTLRAAIAYPAAEHAYRDLAIRHYLELCRLPQLCDSLDQVDHWSQRLSPGEQQRLAFVRALLAQPDVLFLDEATSAVDAETETLLYDLLLDELPQAAIISIAHREAVAKFHQLRWQFAAEMLPQNTMEPAQAGAPLAIQRSHILKPPAKVVSD